MKRRSVWHASLGSTKTAIAWIRARIVHRILGRLWPVSATNTSASLSRYTTRTNLLNGPCAGIDPSACMCNAGYTGAPRDSLAAAVASLVEGREVFLLIEHPCACHAATGHAQAMYICPYRCAHVHVHADLDWTGCSAYRVLWIRTRVCWDLLHVLPARSSPPP